MLIIVAELNYMVYNICCIGHITLDKVVNHLDEKHMAGGTAFYFANAIQNLPATFKLVTAVGYSEMPVVISLQEKGIPIKAITSAHSVYFENIYSENQDHRRQRVLQQADPFFIKDLEDVAAQIFHLGPLLAHDINLHVIKYLAAKGKVSLDVQGLLRDVRQYNVVTVDWHHKMEALPYIHTLKANEFELEALTGTSDIHEGAKILHDWGVTEVVITLGSKGSVIYADNTFYTIPAYIPAIVTDATGCGDTYMAGYLYQRVKGTPIQQAGEFASAMASLKIETSGPFTGTETDIQRLLSRF